MEIISFICDEPQPTRATGFFKSTLGSVSLKKKEKKYQEKEDVSYAFNFPQEKQTFRAGAVSREFNFGTVLSSIGHFISVVANKIRRNLKTFFIGLLITGAVITAVVFSIKLALYKINHTGPLSFQQDDSLDEENLAKFMELFAMEGSLESLESKELTEDTSVKINPNLLIQPISYQTYKVRGGDTISGIAGKFGLKNISSLISVNNITNVRHLVEGQKLKIPNMDGIVYKVSVGDTLSKIADKYKIKVETILDVNELTTDSLTKGQELFLAGVGMDKTALAEVMGDLWKLPVRASFRWSSPYGNRIDPIKKVKSFHTGTDMACPTGTPVYAALSGTVSFTGVSSVFGNYIIIKHTGGYQTLYAHLSKIYVKKGQWVDQKVKIGAVGSTGYSTGPHLHFTVYKNGKLVDPMTVLKKK